MRLPPTLPLRALLPMLLGESSTPRAVQPAARAAQDVFADLIARRRDFLRFLGRRVSSPAIAEDILQNSYLRALEHTAQLRTSESSTAWFYRILRNAVIDFYRRRTVEDRAVAQWASELETEVAPNDLTRDIVCRCIAQVLPTLQPSYAAILQQVDLDEGSVAAFAARHELSASNAAVRLHRARKALKQRLIETCGACAIHECLDCNCIG